VLKSRPHLGSLRRGRTTAVGGRGPPCHSLEAAGFQIHRGGRITAISPDGENISRSEERLAGWNFLNHFAVIPTDPLSFYLEMIKTIATANPRLDQIRLKSDSNPEYSVCIWQSSLFQLNFCGCKNAGKLTRHAGAALNALMPDISESTCSISRCEKPTISSHSLNGLAGLEDQFLSRVVKETPILESGTKYAV
jgi:hypothetical protein